MPNQPYCTCRHEYSALQMKNRSNSRTYRSQNNPMLRFIMIFWKSQPIKNPKEAIAISGLLTKVYRTTTPQVMNSSEVNIQIFFE